MLGGEVDEQGLNLRGKGAKQLELVLLGVHGSPTVPENV